MNVTDLFMVVVLVGVVVESGVADAGAEIAVV